MSVLDAMALIAALTGEPASVEVERLLRGGDGTPRIAGANLAEVVDVMMRSKGFDAGRIAGAVSLLRAGGLEVIPTGVDIAQDAGQVRARRYHRTRCPISLCDCVALATARSVDDVLATADAPLATVARSYDVGVVPLPNSSGERPSASS